MGRRTKAWVAVAAFLFGGAALATEARAGDGRITRLAHKLQRIDIEDETVVPEQARPLFVSLREAVREWAVAQVRAGRIPETPDGPAADVLQKELEALIPKWKDETGYRYGTWAGVAIERVPEHPELIGVQVTLNVPYGCDTSLALLEKRGRTWQTVLIDQSDEPREISDAWCDFSYGVSPAAADGRYFVVTASVNPWPTSNWQSLRWNVLRPGASARRPEVLASNSEPLFLGRDPAFDLVVTRDDFALGFVTSAECADGDGFQEKVRSFQVNGAQLAEIWPSDEPVCDFLADWARAPWTEAASWAHPSASPSVARWHDRIAGWADTVGPAFAMEVGSAEPCVGGPARMQVEVDLYAGWSDAAGGPRRADVPGAPAAIYLELLPSQGELRVLDISSDPHPGCPITDPDAAIARTPAPAPLS